MVRLKVVNAYVHGIAILQLLLNVAVRARCWATFFYCRSLISLTVYADFGSAITYCNCLPRQQAGDRVAYILLGKADLFVWALRRLTMASVSAVVVVDIGWFVSLLYEMNWVFSYELARVCAVVYYIHWRRRGHNYRPTLCVILAVIGRCRDYASNVTSSRYIPNSTYCFSDPRVTLHLAVLLELKPRQRRILEFYHGNEMQLRWAFGPSWIIFLVVGSDGWLGFGTPQLT
jgi:hypothetical protein